MADQTKELKDQLRHLSSKAETRGEARERALKAIQKHPADPELRLILAKLYYLDGYFEFSARELIEVQYLQPTPSVERLLQQFTEYSAPLIARLKKFPTLDQSEKLKAEPAKADRSSKPGDDEVVADLDVDLDLFDE